MSRKELLHEGMQTSNRCPHCGCDLDPDDSFCTACGAQVLKNANRETDATPLCPTCKEPLEPDAAFCIYCGTKLPDSTHVSDDNVGGFCTQCGSPLPPNALACAKCHAPVDGPNNAGSEAGNPPVGKRREARRSSYKPPTEKTAKCSACGAEISVSDKVCPNCHIILDDDPWMTSELLEITREEAQSGCRKTMLTSSGDTVEITIPPQANAGTKVDVPGFGRMNPATGKRGVLRVSFLIG